MNDIEQFARDAQVQVTSAISSAETARAALVAANEELRAANARAPAPYCQRPTF